VVRIWRVGPELNAGAGVGRLGCRVRFLDEHREERKRQSCGGQTTSRREGNPDALIFKDTRKGTLSAKVCGQCGQVDLPVKNPRELWEIYQQHRGA